MGVSVQMDLSVLGRALAAMRGKLRDQNTVLRAVGRILVRNTQERFKTGIAPDGTPWKQSRSARFADLNIAFGVAKSRRKPRTGSVARPEALEPAAFSGKTLVKSGQLRNSISMQVLGGVLLVGAKPIYAGVHQFGATIKTKTAPYLKFKLPGGPWISTKQVTIPARPFLGVSTEDALEVERELVKLFGDLT